MWSPRRQARPSALRVCPSPGGPGSSYVDRLRRLRRLGGCWGGRSRLHGVGRGVRRLNSRVIHGNDALNGGSPRGDSKRDDNGGEDPAIEGEPEEGLGSREQNDAL